MTIQTILPANSNTLQALSQSRNEPDWLLQLRLEALELAGRLELPRLEKTRIDKWSLDTFGTYKSSKAVASLAELPSETQSLLPAENPENIVVQHNSDVVFHVLSKELADKGVILKDLSTAAREHEALVKPHFMNVVKAGENRLTALHAALWTGGVFLYVPRNVRIELPVQALFYSDDAEAVFSPHVLIVAEANSYVAFVDNYASSFESDGHLVHNGIVEIVAKPGAHVQYASVHTLGEQITDLSYRRAFVENDARMEWIIGEMNNGNVMSETFSLLNGNGSFSDAKVICVGTNKQQMNITTKAVHFGRSSTSDMITRAVMRDEATAIINGITKIEKGATDANGEQTERVLMLSPKARGDANPMLLIDEDEVKAGHAASVGQVNPEQLYYLMSRGIPKGQAQRLIIYGFLAPIVSEIPISALESHLQSIVERKLGQ